MRTLPLLSRLGICSGLVLSLGLNNSLAQAQQSGQPNSENQIKVYFFKTDNSQTASGSTGSSSGTDSKDSTVVYADQSKSSQPSQGSGQNDKSTNNALMGIHGDVTMNGILNFVGLPENSANKPSDYRCVKSVDNGKYWGNLLFYGQKWENANLGNMSGDGMVSFSGNTPQSIENSEGNTERTSFPGIQINNKSNVSLQGQKAIRIEKHAVFYTGKLKHSVDTIFFSKNIDSALCDDKDSYIELPDFSSSQALVAKDTVKHQGKTFNFRFPFGSDEAYAPLTVVFKNDQTNSNTAQGQTNTQTYSVFARFDKNMVSGVDSPPFPARKRYDKGANSFWLVKSNIPTDQSANNQITNTKYLIPDSVYAGLEKGYSQKTSVNFRPDRAFITQYIDPITREEDPKPTMGENSNWDFPKLNEEHLRPEVLKRSKAGKQTIVLRYKRDGKGTNLRLRTEKGQDPDYSYYALANYDKHPLTSLFENTKINYDEKLCALQAEWTFSDQFSGQRYFIEITTDTTLVGDQPREDVVHYKARVNDNLTAISNNGSTYRYNLFNTQLPAGIFTPDMELFARILEEDFGQMTVSASSKPFHMTCTTSNSEEEVPLVSATGGSGGGAQLTVQYRAKYPEELSFTIWNILGQKEMDLGSKTINPGLNNLIFNLPANITHGQRYLLLITGGGFNEKVKTYSMTFSIK